MRPGKEKSKAADRKQTGSKLKKGTFRSHGSVYEQNVLCSTYFIQTKTSMTDGFTQVTQVVQGLAAYSPVKMELMDLSKAFANMLSEDTALIQARLLRKAYRNCQDFKRAPCAPGCCLPASPDEHLNVSWPFEGIPDGYWEHRMNPLLGPQKGTHINSYVLVLCYI